MSRSALLLIGVVALLAEMHPATAQPVTPPPITPSGMRVIARDFYRWFYEEFPVAATDAGRHDGDGRLADFSLQARERRRTKVIEILSALSTAPDAGWSVDDRVDLELLRADLNRYLFDDRVLRRPRRDPGLYVEECSNAIFSLLKKDYAPRADRARAAASRLRAMPALLDAARGSLDEVVPLLAKLARQAVDGIGPLYNDTLAILVDALPADEAGALISAREAALRSLSEYGAWLKSKERSFRAPLAMGKENYNTMLRQVYLLPFDADQVAMLGQTELARAKAMEAWLPDPSLADTLRRTGDTPAPSTSAEFLAGYESRTAELLDHLARREILTVPNYIGPFRITELPAAFRPTSPGGFMNPPGVFDDDSTGFFFIPAFDPASENFYMRAALSNPLPILGHEGIPGHFLQISIANHNTNEIRRMHQDGVFQEGWALYGEELLLRTGLYEGNPEGFAQVLRLMRYRAARIAVDVRLATGEWSFDQAVEYFMKEGGLDREAATGEAAGAAASPGQKMNYTVGKHQIQRLLGRERDRKGAAFSLRQFHDQLLSYGSLPLSIVEWLMMDDDSTLKQAQGRQQVSNPPASDKRN